VHVDTEPLISPSGDQYLSNATHPNVQRAVMRDASDRAEVFYGQFAFCQERPRRVTSPEADRWHADRHHCFSVGCRPQDEASAVEDAADLEYWFQSCWCGRTFTVRSESRKRTVIPPAGHLVNLDAPQAFNEAVAAFPRNRRQVAIRAIERRPHIRVVAETAQC
jgi:hypothetical protein